MPSHVVAATAEFPPGTRRLIDVDGRAIVVFNVKGEYFALLNKCPHNGGSLAAGVVTGILVQAAHETTTPDAWRDAIDAIWTHPIVGGSPLIPAPVLAVAGGVALSVGAVAGALSLKRSGNSWPPVVLLAVSSFGIGIFRTHAWPGGPLTFGGMAIAAGWLLWERARAQAHS